ncbi:expressed unknown protein [Seminavis robusta]|uniref:RanBP2-type domain-containing protein n=1 Tax=Seminavis robusta TaxID=568900 RepID=A0A9N8EQ95_9STRA|nr:expressed unknown protein [Seminavis robusta]|eukprot:Sro1384_g268060.2  (1452) ;mRNA; r:5677-10208
MRSKKWTCSVCTLENPARRRQCQACDSRRPDDGEEEPSVACTAMTSPASKDKKRDERTKSTRRQETAGSKSPRNTKMQQGRKRGRVDAMSDRLVTVRLVLCDNDGLLSEEENHDNWQQALQAIVPLSFLKSPLSERTCQTEQQQQHDNNIQTKLVDPDCIPFEKENNALPSEEPAKALSSKDDSNILHCPQPGKESPSKESDNHMHSTVSDEHETTTHTSALDSIRVDGANGEEESQQIRGGKPVTDNGRDAERANPEMEGISIQHQIEATADSLSQLPTKQSDEESTHETSHQTNNPQSQESCNPTQPVESLISCESDDLMVIQEDTTTTRCDTSRIQSADNSSCQEDMLALPIESKAAPSSQQETKDSVVGTDPLIDGGSSYTDGETPSSLLLSPANQPQESPENSRSKPPKAQGMTALMACGSEGVSPGSESAGSGDNDTSVEDSREHCTSIASPIITTAEYHDDVDAFHHCLAQLSEQEHLQTQQEGYADRTNAQDCSSSCSESIEGQQLSQTIDSESASAEVSTGRQASSASTECEERWIAVEGHELSPVPVPVQEIHATAPLIQKPHSPKNSRMEDEPAEHDDGEMEDHNAFVYTPPSQTSQEEPVSVSKGPQSAMPRQEPVPCPVDTGAINKDNEQLALPNSNGRSENVRPAPQQSQSSQFKGAFVETEDDPDNRRKLDFPEAIPVANHDQVSQTTQYPVVKEQTESKMHQGHKALDTLSTFPGFHTAGIGKNITVSGDALKKAGSVLSGSGSQNSDFAPGQTAIGGFKTAGKASNITVSEEALKRAGSILSSSSYQTSGAAPQQPSKGGFLTKTVGNVNNITVSEEALENSGSDTHKSRSAPAAPTGPFMGAFRTAGMHKSITVSEEALQKAGSVLSCGISKTPASFGSGFQTAGKAKNITVSDEALQKAGSILTNSGPVKPPATPLSLPMGGFKTTGKATSIVVSEEALQKNGLIFSSSGSHNPNCTPQQPTMCGFKTAGKSTSISVSQEALQKAGSIFSRSGSHRSDHAPQQSAMGGFQTAGKATSINVSEDALKAAGSILGGSGSHRSNHAPQQPAMGGFQTAGKATSISVSEDALKTAGSILGGSGSHRSNHAPQQSTMGGFQTAGKATSIIVSEDALKAAGSILGGSGSHRSNHAPQQSAMGGFQTAGKEQASVCQKMLSGCWLHLGWFRLPQIQQCPSTTCYGWFSDCWQSNKHQCVRRCSQDCWLHLGWFRLHRSNHAPQQPTMGGFQTAGKATSISVSEDALKAAGSILGVQAPQIQPCPTAIRYGWFSDCCKATSISVSEDALKAAGSILGGSGSHRSNNAPQQPAMGGFQTVAKQQASAPTDPHAPQQSAMGGFQTAGKATSISVSEDALKAAAPSWVVQAPTDPTMPLNNRYGWFSDCWQATSISVSEDALKLLAPSWVFRLPQIQQCPQQPTWVVFRLLAKQQASVCQKML